MVAPKPTIHKAKRVPVREAFPHEAYDFTTWLEENIEALADALGLQLTVTKREHVIPSARIDLLCKDDQGRYVIVENQLEHADHWHLGQVLLYLVSMDAKTAIWVVKDAIPEYTKVVIWLNESTPADTQFYLVKVEAISIGQSQYASFFTKLVGPSETYKAIGRARKDYAEDNAFGLRFGSELLTQINARTSLFQNCQPAQWGWQCGVPIGKPCVYLWYGFFDGFAKVQLNIECKAEDGELSNEIFDALNAQKHEIEKELGMPIKWQPPDNHGVARILVRFGNFRRSDPTTWPPTKEKIIDSLLRFEQVFRPRLENLEV